MQSSSIQWELTELLLHYYIGYFQVPARPKGGGSEHRRTGSRQEGKEDTWRRCGQEVEGRKEKEGPEGTRGLHPSVVTPISACSWPLGGPVTPMGYSWGTKRCWTWFLQLNSAGRKQAFTLRKMLKKWNEMDDKSESSWKVKGLYTYTVSLPDLAWLRQVQS